MSSKLARAKSKESEENREKNHEKVYCLILKILDIQNILNAKNYDVTTVIIMVDGGPTEQKERMDSP